jgi:hypothetical protein
VKPKSSSSIRHHGEQGVFSPRSLSHFPTAISTLVSTHNSKHHPRNYHLRSLGQRRDTFPAQGGQRGTRTTRAWARRLCIYPGMDRTSSSEQLRHRLPPRDYPQRRPACRGQLDRLGRSRGQSHSQMMPTWCFITQCNAKTRLLVYIPLPT